MVKTIKDYYEQIYELFPTIPKKDIQRILNYCWKCVYLHNSYGADVLITSSKFWCFFGILRNNTARHCFVYKIKLVTKLRILYKKKHIKYDGYYYFALTDKQQKELEESIKTRGRPRKHKYYGNQVLYRLLDECKIKESNRRYIYRIPYKIPMGYTVYKPDLVSDKAELIEVREPWTFQDLLVANKHYDLL